MHPWHGRSAGHGSASAVRIRVNRKPLTSSLRRMKTRSPANPTAARVAMAYSAVAIPVSDPIRRMARRRLRGCAAPG